MPTTSSLLNLSEDEAGILLVGVAPLTWLGSACDCALTELPTETARRIMAKHLINGSRIQVCGIILLLDRAGVFGSYSLLFIG
jgi:hypothetical protein